MRRVIAKALSEPHTEVQECGTASVLALHRSAVVWGHCEGHVGSKGGRAPERGGCECGFRRHLKESLGWVSDPPFPVTVINTELVKAGFWVALLSTF